MRVLFYEDPLTDQSSLIWRTPHIIMDAPWLKAILDAGGVAKMMLNSQFHDLALRHGLCESDLLDVDENQLKNALLFAQQNINSDFQRFYDKLNSVQADFNSGNEGIYFQLIQGIRDNFATVIKNYLKGFEPDVIITWAPVPHLRLLFPNALILHKETGMFNRSPFPLNYYLDPYGFLDKSVFSKITYDKCNASTEAKNEIENFRDLLSFYFETNFQEVDQRLLSLAKFEKIILLANHTNNVFFFDSVCEYRSQAHVVIDFLAKIPSNYAVIVSEHPDCVKLRSDEIELIKTKFPNFFCWSDLNAILGIGQKLLFIADEVATVSSSVGLQSIFWGKPLHCLGESHLNGVSRLVANALNEGNQDANDNIVTWLAYNYSYFNEWITRPGFLKRHLEEKLTIWQNNPTSYFDKEIVPPSLLKNLLLKNVKYIENIKKQNEGELDFYTNNIFGKGWREPSGTEELTYRWIGAHRAEISLTLNQSDFEISFIAGTHKNCGDNQYVRVGVGDTELAKMQVSEELPANMKFILNKSLIGKYRTKLWIEAGSLEIPYENGPELSLIISRFNIKLITEDTNSENFNYNKNLIAYNKNLIAIKSNPKHSLLIPTLNGAETLPIVLQTLLKTCPDNCEIVISDNHSTDDTWDIINSFQDKRIITIRPNNQLDYGSNADFCYSNSRGEFISHIGDDDVVTNERFEIIENAFSYDNVEMIFGSRLRYFWPDFPEIGLSNRLDRFNFCNHVIVEDGYSVAKQLINSLNIRHTGAVVINRQLMEKVRYINNGHFMETRLGEYVSYRLASALANKVAFVNLPLAIIGRHMKSIGSSMHHNEAYGTNYGTNTEREIGTIHEGTGFNFKGQTPFSFEASIVASRKLKPYLCELKLDYKNWVKSCFIDLQNNLLRGKITQETHDKVANEAYALWGENTDILPDVSSNKGCPLFLADCWGLEQELYGEFVDVLGIHHLPEWFSNNYSNNLNKPLEFLEMSQIDSAKLKWIDG